MTAQLFDERTVHADGIFAIIKSRNCHWLFYNNIILSFNWELINLILQEIKRMNKDLDGKVKELSSLCMKQKNELSRLSEENERISEQLATYVERPRPQGREANGSSTPEPNGSSHNDVTEDNEWHKKYLAVSEEHEQM